MYRAACQGCGECHTVIGTRDELVAEVEACGWHIVRGLFNEPVEYYCTVCAGEMIARMQRLRLVWLTE